MQWTVYISATSWKTKSTSFDKTKGYQMTIPTLQALGTKQSVSTHQSNDGHGFINTNYALARLLKRITVT